MLLSFVLFSPKQFSNILDFPCSQFPLYLLAAFFTSLHSFLNSFYLCLFCCLSYFLSLFSFTSLSLDSLFHFFSAFGLLLLGWIIQAQVDTRLSSRTVLLKL